MPFFGVSGDFFIGFASRPHALNDIDSSIKLNPKPSFAIFSRIMVGFGLGRASQMPSSVMQHGSSGWQNEEHSGFMACS
jgi:hypothetical protein